MIATVTGTGTGTAPKKHKRNEVYEPYFANTNRYALLLGGRGSGKSYTVADKSIQRVIEQPGHRFAYGRKVYKTVRGSQYETLCRRIHAMGLSWSFEMGRSE